MAAKRTGTEALVPLPPLPRKKKAQRGSYPGTSIYIPLHLARMLAAEEKDLKSDYRNPKTYKEVQELAKSLLRVLMQLKGVR